MTDASKTRDMEPVTNATRVRCGRCQNYTREVPNRTSWCRNFGWCTLHRIYVHALQNKPGLCSAFKPPLPLQ